LPCAQALRGEADGRALVLLDEVGTGTEPVRPTEQALPSILLASNLCSSVVQQDMMTGSGSTIWQL